MQKRKVSAEDIVRRIVNWTELENSDESDESMDIGNSGIESEEEPASSGNCTSPSNETDSEDESFSSDEHNFLVSGSERPSLVYEYTSIITYSSL